jgi:hypothetical protein
MKKNLVKWLCLFVVLFTLSVSASAQVYVKIRPSIPVIVRPAQPSPAHVWIDEEWEPNGGGYRYAGGHWATPPHRGYIRRPGHWRRHGRDGDEWVRGSWRRR